LSALLEIAVADDERVGEQDDGPGAELLDVCERQARLTAKDRNLLSRDVERDANSPPATVVTPSSAGLAYWIRLPVAPPYLVTEKTRSSSGSPCSEA